VFVKQILLMNEKKKSSDKADLIIDETRGIVWYKISRKYFLILCGALFALVIASPTIPDINFIGFEYLLISYISIGFLGAYAYEFWLTLNLVSDKNYDIPMYSKIIFSAYFLIGLIIFVTLFFSVVINKFEAV